MASLTVPTERAARSIPYLILLRGGCALRTAFQPRRWSLTPPFHHCGARLVVRSVRACALAHSLPRSEFLPRFAVYSLWHFPSRTIAVRPPPLTSGSSALRSPDFPLPCGSDRSLARRFRRNCQISRYRMRPHIVQATRPALWSTSCDTLGGWTRWHPSHTPSCVSATTTGQRLMRRRS